MTATTIPETDLPANPAGTGGRGGRRWPLAPLLDTCQCTPAGLADRLNLAGTAVTVAGRDGLSDRQADRWAIRAGYHPVLVWGWEWITASATPDTGQALVATDLRGRIERGELAPGDPLPSANSLARRWGVGHSTVRLATAHLASEGLVTNPGQGERPVVAHPSPLECRTCAECGGPIEPGAEHYPHQPDCTQPIAGWCDCDHPTHPGCCPTCPPVGVRR